MFSRAFNWWGSRLQSHPYSSNIIFGCAVTTLGDIGAQQLEKTSLKVLDNSDDEKNNSNSNNKDVNVNYRMTQYNPTRTLIYISISFMLTPLWLNVLKMTDKIVGVGAAAAANQQQKTLSRRALIARAMKQGMMSWIVGACMTPITVSYMTAMFNIFIHDVTDFKEIRARIEERLTKNLRTQLTGSFCFWNLNSIPIFYLLPAQFRLVYSSFMNVLWQTFVSWLQHRP